MSEILTQFYASIIPNLKNFEAVLQKPLPMTFWVNTLKTTNEAVLKHFAALGIKVEPVAWHPNAFRTSSEKLGSSWPYLLGLIQIQEEVSMLPGVLLDAQPGENILDLCAAPGNKTAQAAVSMKNQGVLVANDNDFHRMRAMGQIKDRLGLMNLSLSVYDAVKYPGLKNTFDRVLVDAPCSCEGTLRKSRRTEFKPSRHHALKMAHKQLLILKKAFQLCKPGGRIVYSTCTFAPEENERVVHQLLEEYGEQVTVVPIELEGFTFSEGVTQWAGETFHSDVKKTMRVWPHQNNTGGFFVAVLKKEGAKDEPKAPQVFVNDKLRPVKFSEWQSNKNIQALLDRFGISESILSDFYFTESSKGLSILPSSAIPPEGIRYDTAGLFFLKTRIQFPKLSTQAAMVFGKYATKHILHLTQAQFNCYLLRETCVLTDEQIRRCDSTGYVILFYEGEAVGMGLYFSARGDQPPRCRSLLPRSIAKAVP